MFATRKKKKVLFGERNLGKEIILPRRKMRCTSLGWEKVDKETFEL